MKQLAEEVFEITGKDHLIDIALELERVALSDDYFITRKLYPNVDFYSGLIYLAIGFPTEYLTVLFALPRFAGLLAHWNEFVDDPNNKIVRPRQIYTGERARSFVPLPDRQPEDLAPYMLRETPTLNLIHLPTILSCDFSHSMDTESGQSDFKRILKHDPKSTLAAAG